MIKLFCVLCAVVLCGGLVWAAPTCGQKQTYCNVATTQAGCTTLNSTISGYECRWNFSGTNTCNTNCSGK